MSQRSASIAVLAILAAALVLLASPVAAEVRGTLRETGKGYADCDNSVEQWSGYFDIPGKTYEKHYFYWGFAPRNHNPDAPVILWLTGGPGCSSSIALMYINGPCHINESTDELYRNEYGWNNEAYVFYLDQPAGVGFSYIDNAEDYDHNEQEVADDIYNFLQRLFESHKELAQNDFFIIGESYGGHYVPSAGYRIHQGNELGEDNYINLMGIGIGNGVTVTGPQFYTYPELAYDWCIVKKGEPCVTEEVYEEMKELAPKCLNYSNLCNTDIEDADDYCRKASDTCDELSDKYGDTGLNMYNIRINGSYEMDAAGRFLNRADVQSDLGVGPMKWDDCNDDVDRNFSIDVYKNFNQTIPPLIENGIRVMIYSGDLDFICNWIGNQKWTLDLLWEKKEEFNNSPDLPFFVDGREAGVARSVPALWSPIQLSLVRVYEAGHMVPMEQPEAAYHLLTRFLNNLPLW